MISKRELKVVLVAVLITLAVLGMVDQLLRAHLIDHKEGDRASPKLSVLSVKQTPGSSTLRSKVLADPSVPSTRPATSLSNGRIRQPEQAHTPAVSKGHQPGTPSAISIPPGSQCPASVEKAYATASGSSETALTWCKDQQQRHSVVIGRSWGSLPKSGKEQWDVYKCNELLNVGKLQSCDQRWGWSFLSEWVARSLPVVQGVSNVTCARDVKSSVFCQYREVVMDFGKARVHATSRSFDEGFLTVYGEMRNFAHAPKVPGFLVREAGPVSGAEVKAAVEDLHQHCDVVESRPTFVLSNDDIYNLGHYYNDVMGIWGMLVMTGIDSKDAVLLNIDGLRPGGPAGVGFHRIMVSGNPDEHGPYIGYYQSWFAEVRKAVDFGAKKVCYKELYLPPMPGVPWFWNDWSQINDCSVQAPSPLYQSYNLFMRHRWRTAYDAASLPNPPTDVVHVIIEVRTINPNKRNNHSSGRHISNLAALLEALRAIPGVKVTAQDFAKLPFAEQVALSHTAGVFVSMHGAGTTHIFHAALGQPNCCALVELFPDTTIELHAAQGYGNLARMLGFHHWRNVADLGSTTPTGTQVDVAKVSQLVRQAVEAVRTRPTCLHQVRDTTRSVWRDGSNAVYAH